MTQTQMHDVVIVGSGPAGYTAAIYTARAGLKPVVIAGSVSAGGALMTTTEIENFPGFPEGIEGPMLMDRMREQAQRFGADVRFEDAHKINLAADIKTISLDDETLQARTVILATGSEYRHLGVSNENSLSGRGISYCATCDGFFFRDKDLVVVGGGDSAMEEATFLTRFASSVTIVHRRDALRASKAMIDRAQADPKISFHLNAVVDSIIGDDHVSAVVLRSTTDNSTEIFDTDGVFVAIGHIPRTELVHEQIECNENGYITVSEPSTQTSLPGVFACGDVVDHVYRQAITAAGSGCRAAIDVEHYLS